MRRHCGFTWLEALVVAGILTILAALLFPLFSGRSRELARRTSCLSNLKQIMLGLQAYTQDYDHCFPLGNGSVFAPSIPPSIGWLNTAQPYLKSLGIFQCAGDYNSTVGNSDFGLSTVVAGHASRGFQRSAFTVALCEIPESSGATATASAPVVVDRHLYGSDYAFVDGHVKWLSSDQAPAPANVPATGSNFTFGR